LVLYQRHINYSITPNNKKPLAVMQAVFFIL